MSTYENAHEALRKIDASPCLLATLVEECVRAIAIMDDDEAQHSAEDNLHCAVLQAIADGRVLECEAADVAKAALKSLELDFARWCA